MSTPHLHPLLMQGTLSHLALSLGRWVGDRLPGRSVTGRWMGECAGSMAIDRWGMGSSIHRSKFGQDYAFPNHWRMKIHVYPFVSGNFGVKTRAFDQDSWNHEGCCNPMLCCLFIADSSILYAQLTTLLHVCYFNHEDFYHCYFIDEKTVTCTLHNAWSHKPGTTHRKNHSDFGANYLQLFKDARWRAVRASFHGDFSMISPWFNDCFSSMKHGDNHKSTMTW